MFSGRIEKSISPISLITIRMRDGADTQAGAVPSKLICLNTSPLIKRMPCHCSACSMAICIGELKIYGVEGTSQ